MLKVALTGGIASGKTTACNYFMQLGVPVIDADHVAKSLLHKEEIGYKTAINLFGKDILNPDTNEIDLVIFRELFFSKPELKTQYEKIIHPIVFKKINDFQENTNFAYSIACIPLLFENQRQEYFDTTILVISDNETRIRRACDRDNVEEQHIQDIINNQFNTQDAIRLADHIIYNDTDHANLHTQIEQLHHIFSNNNH